MRPGTGRCCCFCVLRGSCQDKSRWRVCDIFIHESHIYEDVPVSQLLTVKANAASVSYVQRKENV